MVWDVRLGHGNPTLDNDRLDFAALEPWSPGVHPPPWGQKCPVLRIWLFSFVFRVGLLRFRDRDPSWTNLYQMFKRDQSGRRLTLFEPSKIHSNALMIMQVRAVSTLTMIIAIKCLYK